MKDKQTLLWLYRNSKTQLIPMMALLLGNVLFAVCGVLFALFSRNVVDGAVAKETHLLIIYGGLLLLIIVSQMIIRIFCRSTEARIQGRLEMGYKSKLLQQILHKEYAGTAPYHSGELMNRLTSDITVTSEGVTTIPPNFVRLMTKMLGAFGVLCFLDLFFALIFVAVGLFVFFTVRFFRERLKYVHKNMQEKDGRLRSFIQELLESIIVLKIFNVETAMEEKAQQLQQNHYQAKLKKNNLSIFANSGISTVFALGYLFALLWSAYGLVNGTISFGTLTAILQLVGQVQTPFSELSGLLPQVYAGLASAERIREIENLPDEKQINRQLGTEIYQDLHSIEFEQVSFGYDREMVLCQVDLSIRKGDYVGIRGLSGIGKSTLLYLLLGIFEPTTGSINLKLNNGKRIPIDRHTRKLFAYVPQGNSLLSGSIRENIALVNAQTGDDEIMRAAQVSCAADYINRLPRRLDTIIGEKGHGLSEGQAQRIAIARAILSDRPILLLDEAGSALDKGTEKQLLNNINRMTDKTCLIISHKKAAQDVCNKEIIITGTKVKIYETGRKIEYHENWP